MFFSIDQENLMTLDRRKINYASFFTLTNTHQDFKTTGFLYHFNPRIFFLSKLSQEIFDLDSDIYSVDEINGSPTFMQKTYMTSKCQMKSIKILSGEIMNRFWQVRKASCKKQFILEDNELKKAKIAINRQSDSWAELPSEDNYWATYCDLKKYITKGETGRGSRKTQMWTNIPISEALKVARKHMDDGLVENYR